MTYNIKRKNPTKALEIMGSNLTKKDLKVYFVNLFSGYRSNPKNKELWDVSLIICFENGRNKLSTFQVH